MDTLKEPDSQFDFSKLVLTTPININGGNHFIKYVYDQCPLYIKAPTCVIKQGIVNTSKRIFCDLMFTNENGEFIQFIENLEQYSQKYIYDNRKKWFETELEENDIENSFNSCMKIFKSGKYYCLRVSVPRILGKSNLKIYDENEQLVQMENLKDNDRVTTALEIQGIKCSARSFQIEIEVKQMLLMSNVNIFEKCVLLKKATLNNGEEVSNKEAPEQQDTESENTESENTESENTESENTESENTESENTESENTESENTEPKEEEPKEEEPKEEEELCEDIKENISVKIITEESAPIENNDSTTIQQENEETNELVEIDVEKIIDKSECANEPEELEIPLDEFNENVISLKKKSDVYYEMYRKALQKAKMAKDLALTSFMEAKNIKNTYMLDDIDDSDLDDSLSLESDE
jgi:hypothetical protein